MAWAGTGLLWTFNGGLPSARAFGADNAAADIGTFRFVPISDSHIGFSKEPNQDVIGTMRQAVARINALKERPDFLLHTGDLTHLSKPEEFDTCAEVLKGFKGDVFCVPGEHDLFTDEGKLYKERYGKGTQGGGWRSFDHKGVHFVGLVNVMNLQAGKLGILGADQLDWLKKEVARRGGRTPGVGFGPVPL